jgi:hypothetical protein
MCGPAPSATVDRRSRNCKRAPRDQSALAGKLERGGAFALRAGDGFDRFQCSLRPDPAPLRFWVGSAGSVRARRERWDGRSFPALSRRGDQDVDVPMLAADRSRSAAVLVGLRGFSPRSQGTLGREGLSSAIALGGLGCRRSYARRGLIPLRCGFCGLCGIGRFRVAGRTRIRGAVGGWRRSRLPRQWRLAASRLVGCW